MSDLPFEFFCSELSTNEPYSQLIAVRGMPILCLALGPEKTRKHLLTFLKGEIELNKYTDEVLVAIAYTLGRCVELIGPISEVPCLLEPLQSMCHADETTVRDEAVASLNLICTSMDAEQVKKEFIPIVLNLARNQDWFTPRVSACALFPPAMKKLSGDAQTAEELREAFKALGIDETPMVRRAAALQLSMFTTAIDDERLATVHLMPLYRTLIEDDQDSVRVNALKSTPAICKLIGNLRKDLLKNNFKKCVGDKSWRVRVACAEVIADVGEGCGSDADALVEIKEIYSMLQHDHEAEVRIATALRSADITEVLGPDVGKEMIFPVLKDLVHDPNSIQRIELAGVLMDMAKPLGKENAMELVYHHLCLLLEGSTEENPNVRLLVIGKIGSLIDVVGVDNIGSKETGLVGLVMRLSQDKNWRVRHAVLSLLPKLAHCMGEAEFSAVFAGQEARWVTDSYALIRSDWVKTMADVAARFDKSWLSKYVLPVLAECVLEERKAENYQQRAVLLEGAMQLAPQLSEDDLQAKLCPHILEMCEDKVPNLRIDAVKCCKSVAQHVGAEWREKLLSKLRDKGENDEDEDVQYFAKDALEILS